MTKPQLRNAANISPSTFTKLNKNELVAMVVLVRICKALDCDIGDIVEIAKENMGLTNDNSKVLLDNKAFLVGVKDGNEHTLKELKATLAKRLYLSENVLAELLPSGRQTIFSDRLYWEETYLSKAGLTEKPSRGTFVITKEGLKVLRAPSKVIDADFLSRYESFRVIRSITTSNPQSPEQNQNAEPKE